MELEYPIANDFKNFPEKKPSVKIIGEDSNIFNILSICKKGLRSNPGVFNELCDRVTSSGYYDSALAIIQEYIDVV